MKTKRTAAKASAKTSAKTQAKTMEIGWRERVALPDLGIDAIKAKVDTGARTSALHAVIEREYERDGARWLDFLAPAPDMKHLRRQSCPLIDIREVKNTSGVPEARHVIKTTLVIGRRHWLIELTLTDRENMTFDLILGRTAIRSHHMCVHPGRSFLAGKPRSIAATGPRS